MQIKVGCVTRTTGSRLIEILLRHIIFRNLMSAHLSWLILLGSLNAGHDTRLECISLFQQFGYALRIGGLLIGDTF